MTHPALVALSIIAVVLAAGATTATTTAFALYGPGSLQVEIHEEGPDPVSISFQIPAAALGPALDLALSHVRGSQFAEELDTEALAWLPAASAIVRSLEQAPDGVLVSVEDGTDSVQILLEGGELVVNVQSLREHVRVTVPLRLAARVLQRVEALNPPSSERT